MTNHTRFAGLLSACLLLSATLCMATAGKSLHDRTQFGRNISIGPGEEVNEVTCFACSIHVRGHVASDATAFGGSIVIEDQGQVDGDATAFGGNARLDKGTKVGGDVTLFGGQVRRDPSATVGGDVTVMGGPGWVVVIFALPLVFLALFVFLIVWLVRRMTQPRLPVTA